ncbi:MAG: LemA family protein [Candidatus Peregrinibacteria bacterium]
MDSSLLFVIIAVVIGVYIMIAYNGLVSLKNRSEEAFSDVGVQQKRRYDLIPNLVETVKGYATHEQDTLLKVTEARNMAVNASATGNMKDMAAAENVLSGALKSIFALSENYPDLKANQNFLHLQQELVDAEDKIQAARRFYNQNVQELNTKIEQFPSNLIAKMFAFVKREFFAVEEAATVAPKVSF